MSDESMYRGVTPKEARIYIIGPEHSGIEEIGEALLRSDIKCLKRTTDVNATCQQFRASDGEERLRASSTGDAEFSERLEDGRLRIPKENLIVMVKSDLNSAMDRWATKHGEPSTDDQRNYTRNQVQIQRARQKACATYLKERTEAESVFAEMKTKPDTRSLEVDGDAGVLAVERICREWVTLQFENWGDA